MTKPLFALILLAVAIGGARAQPTEPSASARRSIALTYDDAPLRDGAIFDGEARAAALIANLRAAEAGPVAFFVTTNGMEDLPDGRARIERYAAAGHLIANHTHTHPWAHRTEVADYLADIDRAEALLAGIENRRPWFRYPYLDEGRSAEKRGALVAGLKARGLRNGYVTIDNYDWYLASRVARAVRAGRAVDWDAVQALYVDMLTGAAEFFDEAAVEALGRSPVHVLLLHENDLAALYADDLAAALRAEGWEIVSPDVAYADPMADQVPDTLFTGQGRVAALAADAGRSPRTFTFWASDEAQIDAEIEKRALFGPAAGGAGDE